MNLLLHGLDAPQIDPGNALRLKLTEIGDRDRVDVILTNPPFGGEEERGIQGNFPEDLQTAETALLFLQLIMRKLRRTAASYGPARAAVVVPNTTLFYPGVAARLRAELLRDFNLHSLVRLPKGVFLPYTDIETNILFFDRAGPTEEILYYRVIPRDGRKQYSKTQPLRFDELAECLRVLQSRQDTSPNVWFTRATSVFGDERCNLDLNNPKAVRTTGEDPRAVAAKLGGALSQLASAMQRATMAIDALASAISARASWQNLRLEAVLLRRKDVVEVQDGTTYKRLRIQVKGRGVLVRDEVDGARIGTKRQFRTESGQFVLSKIDARNGAFGVVPDEADGAIITGNFWAYDVDSERLLPRLLHYLTRSDAFIQFCADSSPGATNRRYLQEDLFLAQVVRVSGSVQEQAALCDALDSIEAVARAQERDLVILAKRAPVLLQAALHSVFGGPSRAVDEDTEDEDALESGADG